MNLTKTNTMPSHFSCPDGFCGADDCPRCHPERFRRSRFIELDDPELDDDSPDPDPEPEDLD